MCVTSAFYIAKFQNADHALQHLAFINTEFQLTYLGSS